MAKIAGRNGALYAALTEGGQAVPIAYLNRWSMSAQGDRVEVTSFGETTKTYVQGLPDAQGQYAGYYDSASDQLYAAALDGLSRKTYLYPDFNDTTEYFYGTAFFDFSVDVAVDGAVSISGSFGAATPFFKNS